MAASPWTGHPQLVSTPSPTAVIWIDKFLASTGRSQIAGAPPGVDARLLGDMAGSGRDVLHVARDDARMASLAEALAFFCADVPVLTVPAWDCLPYDRVSPNGEVVSRRIDALTDLASAPADKRGRVVITTVNAALQRVPARPVFAGAVVWGSAGIARRSSDPLAAWRPWATDLRGQAVADCGHFLPEEAPDQTRRALEEFL